VDGDTSVVDLLTHIGLLQLEVVQEVFEVLDERGVEILCLEETRTQFCHLTGHVLVNGVTIDALLELGDLLEEA
jgi:hypothetical protein